MQVPFQSEQEKKLINLIPKPKKPIFERFPDFPGAGVPSPATPEFAGTQLPGVGKNFGDLLGDTFDLFNEPFQALTQGARIVTEDLPSGGPVPFPELLRIGRKPKEERSKIDFSGGLLEDFSALVAAEKEEPLTAQLVGAVVTDPFIAAGGRKVVTKAPDIFEEIATNPSIKKLIEEQAGILKLGDEVAEGGKFISQGKTTSEFADDVVSADDPISKIAAKILGNESALVNTDVGRQVQGLIRGMVADESRISVGLSAAFDTHVKSIVGTTNHILPIGETGFWGKTKKAWGDVWESGDAIMTTAQRNVRDDSIRLMRETDELGSAVGLRAIPVSKKGWLYFPRKAVTSAGGTEFRGAPNPLIERAHEFMIDGITAGVKYENNPRAVMETHMRAKFRQIREAEFSEAIKPFGMAPKDALSKVNPNLIADYGLAIDQATFIAKEIRALQRQIRTLTVTGPSPSAENLRRARTKKIANIRNKIGSLEEELGVARFARDQMKFRYSKALDKIKNAQELPGNLFGPNQPSKIPVSTFRNRIFPRQFADEAKAGLETVYGKPQVGTISKSLESLGGYIRLMSATADFALPLTHGLPVFARNPIAWANGSIKHVIAVAEPKVQANYIKKNLDSMREMANLGMPVSKNEFFEILDRGGVPIGGLLKNLPQGEKIRGIFGTAASQSLGRFQASYDTGLLIYRHMLWDGMKGSFKGGDEELVSLIRNMTGGLDSRALGMKPSRRAAESFWLAFSPRLLRSTTALVGDAVKASVKFPLGTATAKEKQSFQSVATVMGGMMGITFTTGIALGKSQEEIATAMNPLSGKKFMGYEINGDWVGFGGQFRAMAQAIIAIGATIAPGGPPAENLWSTDLRENPFLNAWGNRGAVGLNVGGAVVEGTTGANVLKYDQVDGPVDIAKHIGKSTITFGIQSYLEGQKPLSVGLGVSGFRTSPETIGEGAQRLSEEKHQTDFIDLGPRDKKEIRDQIEEEKPKQKREPNLPNLEKQTNLAFETMDNLKAEESARLHDNLSAGITGETLRKSIQQTRQRQFQVGKTLFTDEIREALDKRTLAFRDRSPVELLRTQFWSAQPEGDPISNPNWYEERDEIRERVLQDAREQGVSETVVRERSPLTDDDTVQGVLDLFDKDQELLRTYWESPNEIIKSEVGPEVAGIWDEYLKASPTRQLLMRNEFPGLSKLISAQTQIRQAIRKGDPNIDVALIRWEYVSSPLTQEGNQMFQALQR